MAIERGSTETSTLARRLLSVTETAEILNHSDKQVRRLIESGDLPHISFGRRKLVHPDDLNAFIAKHRHARPLVPTDGQ